MSDQQKYTDIPDGDNRIEEVKRLHARFCDCTPVWVDIDTGKALSCGKERVLIWWPLVESSGLSMEQSLALFCGLPMRYDRDGDDANDTLLLLGITQVTPDNYADVFAALLRQYEKELWQDNVGKQLLGRIFDGDLEGEGDE